eukprot:1503288-Prymnesium_polylepis.1
MPVRLLRTVVDTARNTHTVNTARNTHTQHTHVSPHQVPHTARAEVIDNKIRYLTLASVALTDSVRVCLAGSARASNAVATQPQQPPTTGARHTTHDNEHEPRRPADMRREGPPPTRRILSRSICSSIESPAR